MIAPVVGSVSLNLFLTCQPVMTSNMSIFCFKWMEDMLARISRPGRHLISDWGLVIHLTGWLVTGVLIFAQSFAVFDLVCLFVVLPLRILENISSFFFYFMLYIH